MPTYIGTVYRRSDGLFESRVKARNHRIVGTSGSQGYTRRRPAERVLRRLLQGGPHIVLARDETPPRKRFGKKPYVGSVYRRDDGRWEWRVQSGKNIVYVSHSQGYENEAAALHVLTVLLTGGPHDIDDESVTHESGV